MINVDYTMLCLSSKLCQRRDILAKDDFIQICIDKDIYCIELQNLMVKLCKNS